jgi:hypothetical protein
MPAVAIENAGRFAGYIGSGTGVILFRPAWTTDDQIGLGVTED